MLSAGDYGGCDFTSTGPSDAGSVISTSVAGAVIIGGTEGTRPPTFWLGDAKVNALPLIAHLVEFLGHIFHLDKLDYCISGVTGVLMHCFPLL